MLAKFAEDDRIEQMNAQKRRMKQQEHKRAVDKLMEERREQYRRDRVSEKIHQKNTMPSKVSVCSFWGTYGMPIIS